MLFRRLLSLLVVLTLIFQTNLSNAAPNSNSIKIDKGCLKVLISEDFIKTEINVSVEKNGKTRKIKFPKGKNVSGLHSGMIVNVSGETDSTGAVSVGTSGFQVVSGAEVAGVGGTRQVVVLRIQSASSLTPASVAQIAAVMNATDAGYRESSYGMFSIKNDRDLNGVPDVYTVPISGSSAGAGDSSAFTFCNTAKANAKAQQGIDTALWNHVVCILPPDMSYSWYGTAYINGRDSVINGNYAHGYADGMEHELGHNLGMHHSNTPGTEYGEGGSIMGGYAGMGPRDFNGPHKTLMAWLPSTAASSGSFELNAVELQPTSRVSSNTLLKIRDAAAAQDLYVSYRAPLGTMTSLNIPYRTSIHTWPGGASQTILLATLGDGETFSQNGISVTQTAHTNVSGSVSIGAVCSATAPSVTISPGSFMSNSGQTAQYTVTVQNRDVNCNGSTTFDLAAALPANFSGSFASQSLTIAAGQSAATTLSAAPLAGSASGNYLIPVSASAAGHAAAQSNATYVLDVTAPSAPGTLKYTVKRNRINLSWLASTDSQSGISAYRVFRGGVLIGSVTSLSFSETQPAGTSTYTVAAVDKAGNISALSNAVSATAATKRR